MQISGERVSQEEGIYEGLQVGTNPEFNKQERDANEKRRRLGPKAKEAAGDQII